MSTIICVLTSLFFSFLMIIKRKFPELKCFPVQVFVTLSLHFHGNTIFYRTDQLAQVAANTLLFFYGVGIVRFAIGERNGLV
jgi:hypothetical protein